MAPFCVGEHIVDNFGDFENFCVDPASLSSSATSDNTTERLAHTQGKYKIVVEGLKREVHSHSGKELRGSHLEPWNSEGAGLCGPFSTDFLPHTSHPDNGLCQIRSRQDGGSFRLHLKDPEV